MHIAFHCTNALCVQHVTYHLCALQIQKLAEHKGALSTMSPLCCANPKTFGAQRCYLPHVTLVQSLFAKSWTKLDMSPKCVCPFSTKTAENNRKCLCTGKAWLIVVTWHQKVKMTKNWTCHLCALNSRYHVSAFLD